MPINPSNPPQAPLRLSEILARQQQAAQRQSENQSTVISIPTQAAMNASLAAHPVGTIAWNEKQSLGIQNVKQRKSFCLIGAAGTGKTTTMKGCVQTLEVNNLLLPLESGTKYLAKETSGIAFVSYTRRAVRQLSRQLPAHLRSHAITIHKLLEFAPVIYEYETPEGLLRKTMRFEPSRHALNPLPRNLKTVVIDECSMVDTRLFEMLKEALPYDVQFIFLGDLHQLPPVYGEAVLAQKLLELPVVELTEVYRQALDSPIISLATKIKNGEEIPITAKTRWESPDGSSKVVINPWPKQLAKDDALLGLAGIMHAIIDSNDFNEEEDIILMPHNKSKKGEDIVGCADLNLHIANKLAKKRGAVVHHVIAGYSHWYLAIGDRLLVDKQDCVVKEIIKNPKYVGKLPMEPAVSLDRWGTYQDKLEHHHEEYTDDDIDSMLERMANSTVDDKKNEASHVLVLENLDTGVEYRVSEVGIYNNMVFAWALTVHKSQGSEWRRVFLFLHQSHNAMISRELVYTAVTRAREELIIICEPDRRGVSGTLTKAAKSPRIKGVTLEEKLQWLKERSAERLKNDAQLELNGK